MKRNFHWRAILIAVVITMLAVLAWTYLSQVTNTAHLTKKLEAQSIELDNKIKQLEQTSKSASELKKKASELLKAKKALESQLQAKARQKASTKVYAQSPPSSGVCNTGNIYKDFIYTKESGCRTTAVNSIGCRGLGQACPGSKMPCGDDFACQDAYFSNYAISRYGSWKNAYNFWLSHRWW